MDRQMALKAFSKGLETFRLRNNYTSRGIAQKLNVSDAFLSNMRKGKALPGFETLCDLIDLGMRLDEIFGADLASKMSADFQKNLATSDPAAANKQALLLLDFLTEKAREFCAR